MSFSIHILLTANGIMAIWLHNCSLRKHVFPDNSQLSMAYCRLSYELLQVSPWHAQKTGCIYLHGMSLSHEHSIILHTAKKLLQADIEPMCIHTHAWKSDGYVSYVLWMRLWLVVKHIALVLIVLPCTFRYPITRLICNGVTLWLPIAYQISHGCFNDIAQRCSRITKQVQWFPRIFKCCDFPNAGKVYKRIKAW